MFNLPRYPLCHRTPGVEGSGSINPNYGQPSEKAETPARNDKGQEIKNADARKYLGEQERAVTGTDRVSPTGTKATSVTARHTSVLKQNKLDSEKLLKERTDLLTQAERILGSINEKKVVGVSLEELEKAQANGPEQVLETLQNMKFPSGLNVKITLKPQPGEPRKRLSLIPPGDELKGQKQLNGLMAKTIKILKHHYQSNFNEAASDSQAEEIRDSLVNIDNKIEGRDTKGQGEGAQAFDQLKSRRCEITVHHRSPVEQSYVEAKHHDTSPVAKPSESERPHTEPGQAERTHIRKLTPSPQKLTTPLIDTENTETLLEAEQSPRKTPGTLSPESPTVPEKTKPDSTPLTEQDTAREAFSHDENGVIDTEEKGLTKTTYSNSQEQAVPIISSPAGDIPDQPGTPVYPVPLPLVNTSQTIVTPQPEEKGVVSPQATDSADNTTTETPPLIQEAEQTSIPELENEGTITAEDDHSAIDPLSTAQEQADPIPHQSVDESLQQPVSAISYSPLSDGDIATEAKLSVTDPAPAPKEQVDAIPQALSIDESPLQTIPVDTHSPLPETVPANALSQEEIQKPADQTVSSNRSLGMPDTPSPRFSDLLELVDKVKSREEQSNQYSPVDEPQSGGSEASISIQEAEQASSPQTEDIRDIAAGAKHSVKAEPSDIQPEKAPPTPPTPQTESTVTPQTESTAEFQDSLMQEKAQDPRSAMLRAIKTKQFTLKPTDKAHPASSNGKQTSGNKAPDSKTAGAPEQNSGTSTTSAGPLEATEESALNGPVSPSGEHQPGAITIPATPSPVPEELEVTQTEVEQISSTQVSNKETDRITVPIDEIDSATSPEEVAQLYTPEPFTGEYQPAQTTFSVSPFPVSEDPQATVFTEPEPISPTQANSRATDDIAAREDEAEDTSSSNKPRSDSKFKAELIQAAAKMMGRDPDSFDTDETTDKSEPSKLSPEELINKMDASLPPEEIVQPYSSASALSEHQTTKAMGTVPETSPETETGEHASPLQTDSSTISTQGLPEEFDDVADDPEHSMLATQTSTQPSQDSDDTGPLKPPSPPAPPPISEALLRSAMSKTAPAPTSTTQANRPDKGEKNEPDEKAESKSSNLNFFSGDLFKGALAKAKEARSQKQLSSTDIDKKVAEAKKEKESDGMLGFLKKALLPFKQANHPDDDETEDFDN